MIGGIGLTEILIILGVIVILFFGARKLPELARALGQSITSFKKGYRGTDEKPPDQTDKKEGEKD